MGHDFASAALRPDERWTLLQIAEAATPAGRALGPPDGATLDGTIELVAGVSASALRGYRAMLAALDLASMPLEGARLSALPLDRRTRALQRLNESASTSWMVRIVVAPLKMVRAGAPELARSLGMERPGALRVAEPRPRWHERVIDARTLESDEELEVDCVVVGTGAGGAPVAARLAARGHAVVLLEEGGYFTRADFGGAPLAMQRRLYRDHGLTLALGNAVIPVPLGRTVGGTTTVNSGTCFRTPDAVLHRWQIEHGLHELGRGSLDPYFEKVESAIGVAPTPKSVLGGVAQVIARGCDALGWEHGPLARNAPGCDAQGVCCFGCPTDAKRSTNVSYVPMALEHGAMLFHHVRASRVLTERGRATGIEGIVTGRSGPPRRVTVRAKTVVLACGAIGTPALLLEQGLANGSGRVGRGLTIHPAGYAWARFAEPIRGWEEVPQGYGVDELVDQGIRFEGAFLPLTIAAGTLAPIGARWTESIERYDRIATFGFMIRETSRGRVTIDTAGAPRVRYRVNDADVRTVVRAQAALARIFLAAGAEVVHPGLLLFDEIANAQDLERLEREGPGRIRAHHVDLSAFHPLGTCAMGADPRRSVVSGEHETHDVASLFVCDGSAVNGPLGVNPQVTIMALSERAATFVERRIERPRERTSVPVSRRELAFVETMSGHCEHVGTGQRFVASFTVRAATDRIGPRGGALELEGTIDLFGIASGVPCRGTLTMSPLRARANLVYDLTFDADDGARCTLHGEKHARFLAPTGMTTLHTEIRREGEELARGTLFFDLRDLPSWLATFRIEARPPS